MSICNRNRIMTGVRFLFRVTLRRLLAVASNLKVGTLLSLGYGSGLRASEVVRLKVKHIDSAQKIIRVEQSKGRNVMLSLETLDLLRQWWKIRPWRCDAGAPVAERWLFSRQPARQADDHPPVERLFHQAADAAGIKKAVTLHALRHSFATPPARAGHRHRSYPGAAGSQQIGYDGALHARRHGMIAGIESPLDLLSQPHKKPKPRRAGTTRRQRSSRPRCPVPRWRPRMPSATMGRRGAKPMPDTSASTR